MSKAMHFPFPLFLIAASALLSGCVSEMVQLADDMRVRARIGVLADTEIGQGANLSAVENAFAFYRQQKVDAVVLTGTVAQNGNSAQIGTLNRIWEKVFKGSSTKLIRDEGRHEVNGFAFATSVKRPVGTCEVLTFYGNRRLPLTDELCFWPRESKAICAGSMHGVDLPSGIEDAGLKAVASRAAQGLLVSDYGDHTVIRRLDFTQRLPEDVAEPWDTSVAFEDSAPEFPSDVSIRVWPGFTRSGEAIYTVRWPAIVKQISGARARWYEVVVAFADQPKRQIVRRAVLSPAFHLAEFHDLCGVTCVFKAEELPRADAAHQQIVFQVTPTGALGKTGRTVSSVAVPLQK